MTLLQWLSVRPRTSIYKKPCCPPPPHNRNIRASHSAYARRGNMKLSDGNRENLPFGVLNVRANINVLTWCFLDEDHKVVYKFMKRRFLRMWILRGLNCLEKKKFEFLSSQTVWPIFRDLNQHFGRIFFKHGLFAMYSMQLAKICLKNVNLRG